MTAIVRGDALAIPLRDKSVDLVVTSPPYFGQRSYRDGDEHFDGQIGSEPHPREFLEALWAVTAECWRVLKDEGSMFVNLGDKRSGSGAPGTTSGLARSCTSGSEVGSTLEGSPQQRARTSTLRGNGHEGGGPKHETLVQGARSAISGGYTQAAFGRAKSKQLLPHRYAIGCEDGLADPDGIGWIMRQDLVWSKPNGMPESVRDRTRDNHEYWFHLTKRPDYFSAVDELRVPYDGDRALDRRAKRPGDPKHVQRAAWEHEHALGALPSSVWVIPTQPLRLPAHLGVDHYAAFPAEWPRRLILGFSPGAFCTACGSARRAVTEIDQVPYRQAGSTGRPKRQDLDGEHSGNGFNGVGYPQTTKTVTITGYGCACPEPTAPTAPAVVLDPFGGTGTTAMVARALGRTGISIDLSRDYNRIATWRVFESDGAARVADRTAREMQGVLL